MALPESQAPLGCSPKGLLYDLAMHIGKRIKLARKRLKPTPTQAEIGAMFGITDKAVSEWERELGVPSADKYPSLRKKLRITFAYLILGTGEPPRPDDPMVLLEDRLEAEYSATGAEKPAKATKVAKRA